MSFAVAGDKYDRFMGRYSRELAPRLIEFARVEPGMAVVDIGCGPGALTERLVERVGSGSVAAADPSEPFVAAARERAPSAELRADQLDEDSLPPYPALDRVLEAYVEQDRSLEELSGDGFDPELVARAVGMIDRAEYKRRQAPPGVRLRPKAFGRDRRTPITNRLRS